MTMTIYAYFNARSMCQMGRRVGGSHGGGGIGGGGPGGAGGGLPRPHCANVSTWVVAVAICAVMFCACNKKTPSACHLGGVWRRNATTQADTDLVLLCVTAASLFLNYTSFVRINDLAILPETHRQDDHCSRVRTATLHARQL